MDNKKRFIIILPCAQNASTPAPIYYTLSDVLYTDRMLAFTEVMRPLRCRVLYPIRRIHTSNKVNSVINLPFKGIWGSVLDTVKWEDDKEYYVIFPNNALYPADPKHLNKLKERHRLKYILFTLETWDSPQAHYARKYYKEMSFDYVLTRDEVDAKKYGFISCFDYYSMLSDPECGEVEYDLYHAGMTEGRYETLMSIYDHLSEKGVSIKMRLMLAGKNEMIPKENVIYNQTISYAGIVEETKKCNCILEVLRENRHGATSRYYEAVCYNKKLLTNNAEIVNYPFYDPAYMRLFNKPEDIDWEWVRERVPIDYHYDGRFSPVHIIDRITWLEEQNEGRR